MVAAEQIGNTARLARGVPFAEYLRHPSLHFSTLKHLETSALHFQHAVSGERGRDTHALVLGRLTHALILTPDLPEELAVYPGAVRRGKAWDEFEANHAAEMIVTRNQIKTAEDMRDAVMSNPEAREILSKGDPEVSCFWSQGAKGFGMRTRLDWLRDDCIVEVKTTTRFHPRAFASEFATRLYFAQLAIQVTGIEATTGLTLPARMIVIESAPPHDVAVYDVGALAIAAGRQKLAIWLDIIERCERRKEWPGVGGGPLELPDWALSAAPALSLDGVTVEEVFGE